MDILNKKSETPLSIAALKGQAALVQYLISIKVSLNHKRDDNCTALFLASMNGHQDVVKSLLKVNQAYLSLLVYYRVNSEFVNGSV